MTVIPMHDQPFKVKVILENMITPVYRKLLIPAQTNMMQMHFIIQLSMGWEFAHLFQFQEKKSKSVLRIGLPDDESFGMFGVKTTPADEVVLREIYEDFDASPFWYWYDFGDDWWHKISFQKLNKKENSLNPSIPLCLEAVGACPPEDVGGPWGYAHMLEIIADKKDPEHKEMREWLGLSPKERYNTDAPDTEVINDELRSFVESSDWKASARDYFDD